MKQEIKERKRDGEVVHPVKETKDV